MRIGQFEFRHHQGRPPKDPIVSSEEVVGRNYGASNATLPAVGRLSHPDEPHRAQ